MNLSLDCWYHLAYLVAYNPMAGISDISFERIQQPKLRCNWVHVKDLMQRESLCQVERGYDYTHPIKFLVIVWIVDQEITNRGPNTRVRCIAFFDCDD